MANNKSNTKVIKIAPEVDKQASKKAKDDIKKLTGDLSKTLSTLRKTLSEKTFDGLTKDSEKSVNQVIKNMKRMVRETNSAVKEMNKSLPKSKKDPLDITARTYRQQVEPAEKVMRDISRRMKIYFTYKTIDLFTNSIGGAVNSLVKLQSAFANIQAITASTSGQMEKIRKSIFDVGVNTRFATEEIADAAVVLGQAGLSTKEIASVLDDTAKLASATGEDLKNTAGLMTSVLSIWNMNADQASHVADVFVTSANDTKATLDSLSYGIQYAGTSLAQLGVSFEETSAVMAASTNAGLKSSSMLGTGMRALATELTNQSKHMKDTLTSLGLTFDDVDIQSLGLIKVLKNLKEAGFGATEAFSAFDRRAATYALAALSELDTAEKLTDSFNTSGAAAKANATQMATLESQLISLSDNIAKSMSTSFRLLTDTLTLILTGINNILKVGDSFIGKIMASATAAGVASKSLGVMYSTLKKIQMMSAAKVGLQIMKDAKKAGEDLTRSMLKSRIQLELLTNAFTSVLKWTAVGAAITLISMAFEKLFYGSKKLEDQIAELNETMETHKSTMNSVASDLEELSKKENLYSEDIDVLNRRIAELNRKYAENGFVVEYANANEDLSEKLKMVREELEAIDRIENKRRANAGYDAAKKKLELAEDLIGGSDFGFFKNSTERGMVGIRKSTKSEIDKILNSNSSDRFTEARNYLLKGVAENYRGIDELLKSGKIDEDRAEEMREHLSITEGILSDYITSRFRIIEAEIDKKAAEFDNSQLAFEVEKSLESLNNTETGFVGYQLKSVLDAVNEGKFESVKSEDIIEAMKIISDEIDNSFLERLKELESQIPEEFRSRTRSGSEISSKISKIEKGTYKSEDVSKLLKTLDSWRNENDFGKNIASKADELYNTLNDYILSQIKTSGTLSDKEKLRRAQEAARALNRSDKLKDKSDPRSTPFLDLRRNELSNIGESTKAAKKARDIRLKGFGYTTGLTSTAQGLYKGYSDEMSLLESARNTERYAKILKELEKEYGYVRTKKEDLTRIEVTALDLMKDTENKLTESSEAYQILTGKTYEYGASLADLNVKYADLTMKTEELTSASTTGWDGFLEGFKNKYKEMSEQIRKNGSISNQIGELVYTSGINGMENALISICDRTKSVSDAFREMLADILKEIRNFLIKQAVQQFFMAMGSSIAAGGFIDPGVTEAGGSISSGFTKGMASGGVVQGGIKGKDSVHTMLMPGEYVMKKSAVDVLGTKFFNSLNTNAAQTMNTVGAMMGGTSVESQSEPSVVNVWVVSEKDEAQMGPNDVIATISKDLQTGGTTKKLIQTIVAGRKA